GRMLSQSPPVSVHFHCFAVWVPRFEIQALPSMMNGSLGCGSYGFGFFFVRSFGLGNGEMTSGSVGQVTITWSGHEQSWVLLLPSAPSQSKSPGAQTSSANGG